MNLYIVRRTDEIDYDEFDSIVVAADNEDEAIKITPYGTAEDATDYYAWTSRKANLEVRLIGKAIDGTISGVIHSSFNAG